MKEILKRNKAITLIALVITIIVLLLLAGISISMLSGQDGILNKATRAKQSTRESEDYDKMALAVQEALVNGYGKIDLDEGSNEKNSLEKALEEAFKGSKMPDYEDGKITLSNGDTYNITTTGSIEKAITFSKIGDLAIGSEVTASNGERFYVIGGDEAGAAITGTTEKVLLLAKYNLKQEGTEITLKQDTTGANNECVFSSTIYWNPDGELTYPLASGKYPDLNDEETYPKGDATSIITVAKDYGKSLGAIGRLMTVEEAVALGGDKDNLITSGCQTFVNSQNYWLASVYDNYYVWFIHGEFTALRGDTPANNGMYGVRPVIEVLMSSIK